MPNAMPCATHQVPSVVISGFILSQVTARPLVKPMTRAEKKPAAIAAQILNPIEMSAPVITPDMLTTPSTERSNIPPTRRMTMAASTMVSIAMLTNMTRKLAKPLPA